MLSVDSIAMADRSLPSPAQVWTTNQTSCQSERQAWLEYVL